MRPGRTIRRGLSLLEVIIALAVFLLSYVAIWQLMNLAGDQAISLTHRNQATQLAQSKLAEVAAGVEPMEAISETPFEEAPDYNYAVEVNDGPVETLKLVVVTVTRTNKEGGVMTVKISQMMLDPTIVGSTQDVQGITGTDQPAAGTTTTPPTTP